ncbi:hypothetical protein [Aliiroseovarius sp.]|uniref:hypothetical protein n=1 Tax=Aliiroseovarius sp. TaxID=1872442 RepID=UPI0026047A07|nr:hypothetical protein [Aliiroseovarius sp.]
MSALVVTHLFPTLPPARVTALEADLRKDCVSADAAPALDLRLAAQDGPLGGEAFCGTIAPDSTPSNRAALMGIISGHGAHLTLTVDLPDGQAATRRKALRLALMASQALVRHHPPLAILWTPTGLLMQRAALDALASDAEPLTLFVSARDELTGPRRVPSLAFDGAPIWIGQDLHARLGALPREVVRSAAFAFLAAARQSPELVRAQSFHHAGHSYRLAHAPERNRVDLIPAAQDLLHIRPEPSEGLRPTTDRNIGADFGPAAA